MRAQSAQILLGVHNADTAAVSAAVFHYSTIFDIALIRPPPFPPPHQGRAKIIC